MEIARRGMLPADAFPTKWIRKSLYKRVHACLLMGHHRE